MRTENISRPLTAEEAFWLTPCERWELVDGRIVALNPTRVRHGKVLSRLDRKLGDFVERHDLGEVYVGDVGFVLRRDPDTVRGPDLAFIRKSRLPAQEPETFSDVVPDLAVEILSPSDRWSALEQKVAEYLEAGVAVVWAIDPGIGGARVYRAGKPPRVLDAGDVLAEPSLFPGLGLSLADLLRP